MFFYLKDTATTGIYTDLHTLSLHDALPILRSDTRVRPTPAARTFRTASPGPGTGSGRSSSVNGCPHCLTTIARIFPSPRLAPRLLDLVSPASRARVQIGRAHV